MQTTPKGLRLHIGIFGRRNVGKSSFLNALTRQQVSIVSDVAGTTTDPVEKPMELLPIGPVLFIDTAGIDDTGALGKMRVDKTKKIFDRTEVAVIVAVAGEWGKFEDEIFETFRKLNIPVIAVLNKADISKPTAKLLMKLDSSKIPYVKAVATEGKGLNEFRDILIKSVPEEFISEKSIAGDLLPPGSLAMLVVPIDLEAPKGRLILPQVQTIRDILDNDSYCMVVKERELRDALERLKRPPNIVITDSQGFLKVAGDTPNNIPLTSFSILFARFKGDLDTFVEGALAIEKLKPGDKVLMAEACSHHPVGEDIGRIKIPRWLTQYVGGKLDFEHTQGCDFPEDISKYKLIVHCGSCTFNRRLLLSRLLKCREAGVPITNYGVAIAYSLGIFERALSPFPGALDIYRSNSGIPARE
ncbi:MAG TPA: [FeFe] hydrogenase H-cluster maturation GTPase HydF [Lentisphaeria bacterium]|nr:MAG: [FeFe] hydrogenase H-cluster maturation GTPase HydF [Lentisphaerae bacterium GWF2_50_93]HCE43594.1 [FeFe] hydrogenase H-cluster maturation GTPase HydF [Lentisphaeria bacterium]